MALDFVPDYFSAACRAFPGKYPTRFIIRTAPLRPPFFYAGKPSPSVFSALANYVRKHSFRGLSLKEIDQNGLLYSFSAGNVAYTPCALQYLTTFPFYWNNLTSIAKLYVLINRTLVKIQGQRYYISPFMKGTPWETTYERAVAANLKVQINRRWFWGAGVRAALIAHIEGLAGASLDGYRAVTLDAAPATRPHQHLFHRFAPPDVLPEWLPPADIASPDTPGNLVPATAPPPAEWPLQFPVFDPPVGQLVPAVWNDPLDER